MYNKFYIARIIDIANRNNIIIKPATDTKYPIIPVEGEQYIKDVLGNYDAFDMARRQFRSQNLMFTEQVLNNNLESTKIRSWSQTANIPHK